MMKLKILVFVMSLIPGVLFAQDQLLTGKVTFADDGLPLPGVTVVIKGTQTGTVTNVDGVFSISAPEGTTIIFSFVGMLSQELVVGADDFQSVVMEADIFKVEQVVVTGYGVRKKSAVTGAIARIDAEQFADVPVTRVEDALKGRTAGVTVIGNSGQPGAGSIVRIRGTGTINNSDPLYIVDGMPVGGIDYLNPNDIANITVLKDAASSAIYGSRAANGVVLVTTKKGKAGRTQVTYDAYYGIQNPWKKASLLNASEYALIMNEAHANAGMALPYADPSIYGEGTDWQDEVFNYNAPIQSHSVSVTGGNEKVSHYASFSYYNQDGIVAPEKSNYERYSIRLNTTYDVFKRNAPVFRSLKVASNISYSNIKSMGIDENSEWGSTLGSALMVSPITPVYETDQSIIDTYPANYVTDDEGNVFAIGGEQEIVNPVAELYTRHNFGHADKFVTNFTAELELINGLSFKSSFNADLAFWGDRGWTPVHYLGVTKKADQSSVFKQTYRGLTWLFDNFLEYKKSFGQHDFRVLAGTSAERYAMESVGGRNYALQEEDPDKAYIDFATAPIESMEAWGTAEEHTLASYIGRLNYSYADKYFFEGVMRVDGSSNFGPENKWGVFPSLSAGWIVSREAFMDSYANWLSFLKLRAGWGQNGNEAIGAFNYTTTLQGGNNYTFGIGSGETIVNGVKPKGLTNPAVQWETSEQLNLGFDARFFNDALTFTVDYFDKKTRDMLIYIPVPAHVGDASPWGNVGTMTNKGVEFELGYKFFRNDFTLDIIGNATYLKNTLTNIGNESGIRWEVRHAVGDFISRSENGMPVGYFYGYRTDGIFQSQAEVDAYLASVTVEGQAADPVPGDIRFKDLNNDGFLNDQDREMIGNPTPDWTLGLNVAASYKGFDARLFVMSMLGNDVYDATRRPELTLMNYSGKVLERWVGEGTSTSEPRVTIVDSNRNTRVSDRYVYDGSFLRIKDLQFGYTLPKNVTDYLFMQKLRVYVSASNLFTFTAYDGFDPEIGAGGVGIDKGIYPQARTYTFGVNVQF